MIDGFNFSTTLAKTFLNKVSPGRLLPPQFQADQLIIPFNGPVHQTMAPPSKLAIATSAVQRLVREEESYHEELEQQKIRIQILEETKDSEDAEYQVKQEVGYFCRLRIRC